MLEYQSSVIVVVVVGGRWGEIMRRVIEMAEMARGVHVKQKCLDCVGGGNVPRGRIGEPRSGSMQ